MMPKRPNHQTVTRIIHQATSLWSYVNVAHDLLPRVRMHRAESRLESVTTPTG